MVDASDASFDLDDSDADWRTRKTSDTSASAGVTRHGASGAEVCIIVKKRPRIWQKRSGRAFCPAWSAVVG